MLGFTATHFRSLLDRMEAITEAHYGLVLTPAGRGQVVKREPDKVYVELADGSVKDFAPLDVKPAEQADRRQKSTPRHEFTPAQLAAGRNTPILAGKT